MRYSNTMTYQWDIRSKMQIRVTRISFIFPDTHKRRCTVDGPAPHRLGMITYAETADRRSWHVEKAVSDSTALKIRTVLFQGI